MYWPIAGDRVRTNVENLCDFYRVKSSDSRERTVSLWVPSGTDDDGDVTFEVVQVGWKNVRLYTGEN